MTRTVRIDTSCDSEAAAHTLAEGLLLVSIRTATIGDEVSVWGSYDTEDPCRPAEEWLVDEMNSYDDVIRYTINDDTDTTPNNRS